MQANLQKLFDIAAREAIGRAKMVDPSAYEEAYDKIIEDLRSQIDAVVAGGDEE